MQTQLRNNSLHSDEAFSSLLSSQRELLQHLHKENGTVSPRRAARKMSGIIASMDHRRASMELLSASRHSLSGLDFKLPAFSLDTERIDLGFDDFELKLEVSNHAKRRQFLLDCSDHFVNKRRRLSTFGLSSKSFFEDNLKISSHHILRRGSMISAIVEDVEDDDDDDDDKSMADDSDEVELPRSSNIARRVVDQVPVDEEDTQSNIVSIDGHDEQSVDSEEAAKRRDPAYVKSIMEAFNKAMEKSQKTQQDIHDWDRKMGLKRSHSKTMRLSSRSRKKLRSIMKKEITTLASKIASSS